jgi:hypothetical protein
LILPTPFRQGLAALALLALGAAAVAQERHTPEQTRRDIERHRAMAAAHEAAARCLERNQGHDTCQTQLQAACKGLGIGKHCGMKHAH